MEKSYRAALRRLIRQKFADTDVSLCDVLPHCEGAFPSDVREVLQELDKKEVLVLKTSKRKESRHRKHASKVRSILPPPHPANYDWRFTRQTRLRIKRKLLQLSGSRHPIALLGTPSVYELFRTSRQPVVLFDGNYSTISQLKRTLPKSKVILHDLFDRIEGYKEYFRVVLADPPWYPEYYQAFIARAAEVLSIGGWMLISMLPRLTRPSAMKDRERVERSARLAGFALRRRCSLKAWYESPTFETKTLEDIGIFCPKPWRVADLYLFRKIRGANKPILTERSRDARWLTFRVSGTEIKLRDRRDHSSTKLMVSRLAEQGTTLGSVSRRNKKREQIDLWTSHNIAFSISRIGPIREVLIQIEEGTAPEIATKSVGSLFRLAKEEQNELRNLLNIIAS